MVEEQGEEQGEEQDEEEDEEECEKECEEEGMVGRLKPETPGVKGGLQEDQILLTTREPSSSCRNLSPIFLVNMKAGRLVSCQREKNKNQVSRFLTILKLSFCDVVIVVCNSSF